MPKTLTEQQRHARLTALEEISLLLTGQRRSPTIIAALLEPYSPHGRIGPQAVHNTLAGRTPVPDWYIEALSDVLRKRVAQARALQRALWLSRETLGLGTALAGKGTS